MDSSVQGNVSGGSGPQVAATIESEECTGSNSDSCQQVAVTAHTKVLSGILTPHGGHNPHTKTSPIQTPAQVQVGDGESFEIPGRRRGRRKSSAGTPAMMDSSPSTSREVEESNLTQKPLFKQPAKQVNPNLIFLWNAGGKRKNKKVPTGADPPKQIVIDNVPIFGQTLTAAQAEENGVEGWDTILDNIKDLHHDVVELPFSWTKN